ncbi:MAG: hypothetical protein ACOC0C_07810 [Bacteroidota bacterium]
MNKFTNLFIWVTIFSIAMGFLESAVVVYLRELFYPGGFVFPLQPITPNVAVTEIGREAATLVMLLSIGFIAGRNGSERFAWFLYTFAIWDIFYYVFLYILLGWPEHLLVWDILFLIPVTWVGPVIAPVILAFTMILLAVLILLINQRSEKVRLPRLSWVLLIVGSVVCILSFTIDYSRFIMDSYSLIEVLTMPDKEPLFELSQQFIPEKFGWWIFWLGEVIILGGIWVFGRKYLSSKLEA